MAKERIRLEGRFPEDWIMPGEFVFGPSGELNTLSITDKDACSDSDDCLEMMLENDWDEDDPVHVKILREELAKRRKEIGMLACFWTEGIEKPVKTPNPRKTWDEHINKNFVKYHFDPRK